MACASTDTAAGGPKNTWTRTFRFAMQVQLIAWLGNVLRQD